MMQFLVRFLRMDSLKKSCKKKLETNFTKEATDTILTVIAQNSYALEHSFIREQVGAVIASLK